jgi:hypothetical protein
LGESQYFAGAFASKICDKEHSTTTLGDSEEAAVHDSPRKVSRPDVCQRLEDSSKVSALIARQGSKDVFPDGEVGLAVSLAELLNNSNCLMEEPAPFASKASTFARNAEILAGRAEGHYVHRLKVVCADLTYVVVQLGIRKPEAQD